jgi:hypothetical protein
MKFEQFVDFWTLLHHPSRQREWSLEQKFRAIKKAGFKAICAPLDAGLASMASDHGLVAVGMIFPDTRVNLSKLLRAQKEFGVADVHVQLGEHDTTPADALKTWLRLEEEAEKLGLEISLSVHRDSVTETPEKLYEFADRYLKSSKKQVRLAWDFSHWGVVKHLRAGNFVERLLARPELVQAAKYIYFRPFNSHHAQLPVTNRGELTPELRDYIKFVEEVMQVWKAAPQNQDRVLFGCPSLGPKGGYALSNFPAVWPDALALSAELNMCWRRQR